LISIIEPYPSRVAIAISESWPNIAYERSLGSKKFDAIVAQDVLEHVEDPISLAYEIALSARENGKIIFANCFYPVIACHLPSTFHLRHSFHWVMRAMGLRYLGRVDGASHAQVFEKSSQLSLSRARFAERLSMLLGPFLNIACRLGNRIMRLI
jgi:2-polyprenyl-6-hydroxyphenyl methylase/3-demethylubiquinone-9 3-methyltransferase